MKTVLIGFALDEGGATAIEYGLIASLIALVVIVGLGTTGDGVMGKWQLVMERVTAILKGSNGGEGAEGEG